MTPYRFLIDRDVEKIAGQLSEKRVVTLAKAGLREDARDSEILRIAWEGRCTIVTANGRDFLPAVQRFLSQTKIRECHDLFGLVVLPAGFETQRRILIGAEQRMRFGNRPVTWTDVWDRDYYVRLRRDGAAEVRLLPRCRYCDEQKARR